MTRFSQKAQCRLDRLALLVAAACAVATACGSSGSPANNAGRGGQAAASAGGTSGGLAGRSAGEGGATTPAGEAGRSGGLGGSGPAGSSGLAGAGGGAGLTGVAGFAAAGGRMNAGGAGAPGQGGAGGRGAGPADRNKLDLLFLIDDSASMKPMQAKLAQELPSVLSHFAQDPVTGLPVDLHVGVVSSSMGAGAWGYVNQCTSHIVDPETTGDYQGSLLQGPGGPHSGACPALNAGETFLATGDGMVTGPNFTGDLGSVFACMALIGDKGCGFESPFGAVQAALQRGSTPRDVADGGDPDNGGFVRPDARLAVVLLTNEDDCSVPATSLLLSTAVNSVSDPTGLGALQSYRCNEFGHLCDDPAGGGGPKVPPPHSVSPTATAGVTLTGCQSAEDQGRTDPLVVDAYGNPDPTMGHLVTVESFVTFLKGLKSDPDDVFVAAIAAPPTPYVVIPQMNSAAMNEIDPVIQHSCTIMTAGGADPEYGDPAVRITQAVQTFGTSHGFTQSVCDSSYASVLTTLAAAIFGG
ncbi:MAG TPA: hypothetical protein VIU64_06435 [Polyangia bacterium]